MVYEIRPQGVCAQMMTVDVEDGIVRELKVMGGCDGNLKGIAQLVRDRRAEDVVTLLRGICCGTKGTSCPDQLALGLEQIIKQAQ